MIMEEKVTCIQEKKKKRKQCRRQKEYTGKVRKSLQRQNNKRATEVKCTNWEYCGKQRIFLDVFNVGLSINFFGKLKKWGTGRPDGQNRIHSIAYHDP
jgi:hypothetical protein